MSTKISDLVPDVAVAAQKAVDALTEHEIPFAVTDTLRTEAQQAALFAQGRQLLPTVNMLRSAADMLPISSAENKYTVTNCDGITNKSNHQGGRALDVVPTEDGKPVWPEPDDHRWRWISSVMKEFGFQWGGDWPTFPDYPHYQMEAPSGA